MQCVFSDNVCMRLTRILQMLVGFGHAARTCDLHMPDFSSIIIVAHTLQKCVSFGHERLTPSLWAGFSMHNQRILRTFTTRPDTRPELDMASSRLEKCVSLGHIGPHGIILCWIWQYQSCMLPAVLAMQIFSPNYPLLDLAASRLQACVSLRYVGPTQDYPSKDTDRGRV